MFPFEQRLNDEEKKELIQNYRTLEEAYLILYFETEFKKLGYKVSRNKNDIVVFLENGKARRFDFSLKKQNSEQKIFVDLDMGNLYETHFFDMLDKTYKITQDVYFVAKDEYTLYNSTKYKTFKWINQRMHGIDNVKNKLTLNFSTLEWLILGEKEWEKIKL